LKVVLLVSLLEEWLRWIVRKGPVRTEKRVVRMIVWSVSRTVVKFGSPREEVSLFLGLA
jgi:hypothetical protein